MLVKLKTAYAYKGETLCAGEIVAVDNTLADSLFLKGYAVFADDDSEDDYEFEHSPLKGQEFSVGEGTDTPESVNESEEPTENADEGEETPPQEIQTDVPQQSQTQEAETVPLGRSGKAGKK